MRNDVVDFLITGNLTKPGEGVINMARKKIQGPLLTYMLDAARPVRSSELVTATGATSSSVSGALNRLKGNGVVAKQKAGWIVADVEEALWLTQHTYHTKTRDETGPVVQPSSNGALMMGDLFEMIGRLPDGANLVRTLETGIVYRLEEV